ncbi:MAG: FAD-dependent oxidoreductase [Alphaproteobacteria bacterium]|nr:FAD-dependent oxidoreductase [Alphaproteobacteria bacterium]
MRPLDVAVIGSGVAGLGAAWLLSKRHRVTLYEKENRFGGHANTFIAKAKDKHGRTREVPVDTGFIVYNEATYPNLIALFDTLGVKSDVSNMSFAVSVDRGRLEYSGGTWTGLFAQPSNFLRPAHWRMLRDTLRFFRDGQAIACAGTHGPTLGEFLAERGYCRGFVDNHLIPMAAAIWSCPPAQMLEFPARSFCAFFRNHGLLQLLDRPQWRSVAGGSREYVAKLLADIGPSMIRAPGAVQLRVEADGGVKVRDAAGGLRRHDRVLLACHADEALALIENPTAAERDILGSFAFQPNLAILHQDEGLMPKRKLAWASWNYLAESGGNAHVSVTYWMNKLQNLDRDVPLFVSLNPIRAPRPETVLAGFEYMHPAFDTATLKAQARLHEIQNKRGLLFAGAWSGYGFHEDGLRSGLDAAEMLGVRRPWGPQISAEILPFRAAAE